VTARLGVRLVMLFSVLLTAILYFGNFTQKKDKSAEAPHATLPEGISFEAYAEQQLKLIKDASVKDQILKVNRQYADATVDTVKSQQAHLLAELWKSAGNNNLEAYYHYLSASADKDAAALAVSGEKLISLYRSSQDTLIKNNLITFALRSLEAASALNPDNLELKVKLGSAYVEGSPEPMKGITLLREVVEKDPENISALIMLGRFAILSGQYDKAKERLDQVLVLDPNNAEAIYFMAITQEGLGNNEKAIELLEACKKIVANPDFDAEINGYIEQLRNKIK
jgi:predicted Zn-dependent protease